MPLGTVDRTPPPFFKQGASALSKLLVFSALAVLLMVVAKHLSMPILKQMQQLLVHDGKSRGIAFTVPIDHLTGLDMAQVMKFEQHLRQQD